MQDSEEDECLQRVEEQRVRAGEREWIRSIKGGVLKGGAKGGLLVKLQISFLPLSAIIF